MRILKFVGAFLGTLLLILLLTFGFNTKALFVLFENSDDLQEGQEWVARTTSLKTLTDYIGLHPERVAVVSRSAVNPDTSIRYSADVPHTMGTLSNFFLITTYARLVEENLINPNELIPLSETGRFQLPYIDHSHHETVKAVLADQGVLTPQNKVPLENLVQSAIIYNDLAISDFLYYKLGIEAIRETYRLLNIQSTDLPLPFSGLYITLSPALHNASFDTHFASLRKLSEKAFRDKVLVATKKYLQNKPFHRKVNAVFNEQQGLGIQFKQRRDVLALFPKSTAGELSRLVLAVQQEKLISPAISQRVWELLDWPFERQNINSEFKYYGALYDSRLGLLAGIDFGASTYSGEPFAQAVFFDSLQVAFWFHMSSNLMHQDYQRRLMWDPALRSATLQEISK
ncbi:MAG TPA: hypothetical protein VF181_06515 [Balneolaceae bacterium]